MEFKNISIENVLNDMDNKIVCQKKKSPVLGSLLIILAFLCLALSTQLSDTTNNIWSPLLIMSTITLLISGIILLLSRKKYYVSASSKKKLDFKEIFFETTERDNLIRVLKNNDLESLKSLKNSTHDTLKLRVAASPTGDVCLAQVLAYIPYEYVNITEVYEFKKNEAETLLKFIYKNK